MEDPFNDKVRLTMENPPYCTEDSNSDFSLLDYASENESSIINLMNTSSFIFSQGSPPSILDNPSFYLQELNKYPLSIQKTALPYLKTILEFHRFLSKSIAPIEEALFEDQYRSYVYATSEIVELLEFHSKKKELFRLVKLYSHVDNTVKELLEQLVDYIEKFYEGIKSNALDTLEALHSYSDACTRLEQKVALLELEW